MLTILVQDRFHAGSLGTGDCADFIGPRRAFGYNRSNTGPHDWNHPAQPALNTMIALQSSVERILRHEAEQAYPRECCGFLSGYHRKTSSLDLIEIVEAHPVINHAARQNRFEIDPKQHFALIHLLRKEGLGRSILGHYHSHPNGQSHPSSDDIKHAWDEKLIWSIIATQEKAAGPIGFFLIRNGNFQTLPHQILDCG